MTLKGSRPLRQPVTVRTSILTPYGKPHKAKDHVSDPQQDAVLKALTVAGPQIKRQVQEDGQAA